MRRRLLLLAVILGQMIAVLVPVSTALAAAPFARAEFTGYFDGTYDDEGDSVEIGGVHPVSLPLSSTGKPCTESFISIIMGYLNTAGNTQTGAEFIILTMTGHPAGTSRATAHTAAVVADWKARVRYYSDNDWIAWGAGCNGVKLAFDVNTYWQGDKTGPNPDDDAWYNDPGNSTIEAIIFHQPGTTDFYNIKENCANPIGDANGLTQPNFGVSLSASSNPPQTGPAPVSAKIVAGDPVDINVALTNAGPAATTPGTLQIMYPGPADAVAPCPPFCVPGPAQQTALTGGHSSLYGFRGSSAVGLPIGRNWFWDTTPFVGTTSGTITFIVPPGLAAGTTFNIEIYYTPSDLAGSIEHKTLSFKVISKRVPGIAGINGDVHAGDCTQAAADGYVLTNPAGASMGQYVVSATGSISNFASNNNAADSLKIGASGGYQQTQLCRPDLYALAHSEDPIPGAYGTFGSAPVVLNGSEEGVYYHRAASGPTLFIHGVVGNPVVTGAGLVPRRPLTIIADGDVVIDGDITLTTTALPPHSVPSLGIIAAGNIYINPGATVVNAYLFANGNINTCNGTSAQCAGMPPSPPAWGALRVNGFLMGKSITFGRLGLYNTNGKAASETVVLSPEIYLNPPKYFDSSIDNVLLEGQGERAPLF